MRWFVALVSAFLLSLIGRAAHAGYVHTWTWKSRPSDEALARCVVDLRKLAERRPELVVEREPKSPLELRLDGKGDLVHDAFAFPGKVGLNQLDTARRPYDEVVTASLLVARDHFSPEVLTLRSDGTWLQWQDGILLYTETFGRAPTNPGLPEGPGFRPGGRFEMPDGMPRDRWSNPRTRPWGMVIALCFAGLIVLMVVPTRQE